MVQATMSNAGKSLVCAGLCRIFRQDGYRVAPFKSQNMARNSFITDEGLEMGRAQVVQAEACGIAPSVRMNPILLKPVTHVGSQVIVNGEVLGNMSAGEYYSKKQTLRPVVQSAYDSLAAEYDIVVLEGAGSPAEINLRQDDFVNMGMAKMAGAPVLLVGDIDRGGVFAQLYGTVALLSEEERRLVRATVINKFRGDVHLLTPGLSELEKLTGVPVAGVVPFLPVDIEDEDSLAERLARKVTGAVLDIAVIRLPHLSNFTDFAAFEATRGVAVRYIRTAGELGSPDMVILPGTKSTIADLSWLREQGLVAPIKRLAAGGTAVFGVCGGYQMLGGRMVDAEGSEGGGDTAGLGLLPVQTEFAAEKHRSRVSARVLPVGGTLGRLAGTAVEGYEIHMGRTTLAEGAKPFLQLENGAPDGCALGSVYGSYLHGFFDAAPCREAVLRALGEKKGISLGAEAFDLKAYKERQYDLLAEGMRKSLDMELIRRILQEGV
jgi:adenosylcobyric acid synthase